MVSLQVNAAGTALTFSTCLGTGGIADLALGSNAAPNVYVAGTSDSTLPLKNPIQVTPSGVNEAGVAPGTAPFVAATNPNSNTPSLLFSSFLGGGLANEVDIVAGVGVDSGSNIYAAGTATAGNTIDAEPPFPVFNALQRMFTSSF
jgi:hypothetical protein